MRTRRYFSDGRFIEEQERRPEGLCCEQRVRTKVLRYDT